MNQTFQKIVGGVLGFRAADPPEKAGAAFVFGAIAFAMCVIALLLDFSVQSLCGSIVPLLYLICASAVRKSA